jgi:predicted Ser/Thr protein kinase
MTMGAAPESEQMTDPADYERLGPYRLLQRLGEGGMGVVHLALDPSGRAVAIKVLRPHIAHDEQARRRLAREVETLSRVRDPRVAAVLDADVDGPRPYVVTEYVPGPPLDVVVETDGPVQGEALVQLARGLLSALRAIHAAGVVHRDLKPGNVLMVDGEPVVIDFGIAHVADDVRLTSTGLVMGTPGYLSPEVVEGGSVTEATDWWGWAATLAYAASGDAPFGRGPMPAVLDRVGRGQADLSQVDPRLAPLLDAALSPDPAERPGADEVMAAIERYANGAPSTMVLPTHPEWVPRGSGHDDTVVQGGVQGGQDSFPEGADPYGAPGASPAQQGWGPQSEMAARWEDSPPESDWQAAWETSPGQPDPRIGQPMRSGTLAVVLALVVALGAVLPLVAAALVVLWSLAARFADRSVTSLVLRRHTAGHRRSDVPLAVAASPWHLLRAALATVLALLLPAFVALATALSTALGLAVARGGDPDPERALPVAAGLLLGLLMMWWGPGGASLRRGSRSLVRGSLRRPIVSTWVVAALGVAAAALALWAWQRSGVLDWWPLQRQQLPFASLLDTNPFTR